MAQIRIKKVFNRENIQFGIGPILLTIINIYLSKCMQSAQKNFKWGGDQWLDGGTGLQWREDIW